MEARVGQSGTTRTRVVVGGGLMAPDVRLTRTPAPRAPVSTQVGGNLSIFNCALPQWILDVKLPPLACDQGWH